MRMGFAGKTAVVPIATTPKGRQQGNALGTAQRLTGLLMRSGLAEQRRSNQWVAWREG